jgi:hypothetical protein
MAIGTCPKCGDTVTRVQTEPVTVMRHGLPVNGISYLCSSCKCVLSVAIDPVALQKDVLEQL